MDVYVSTHDMASHVQLDTVLSHIGHWVTITMIMVLNCNLTTKFPLLPFHSALPPSLPPLGNPQSVLHLCVLAQLLCIWNSFFLLMKSIPYYGVPQFSHSFTEGHTGSLQFLLPIKLLWIFEYKQALIFKKKIKPYKYAM